MIEKEMLADVNKLLAQVPTWKHYVMLPKIIWAVFVASFKHPLTPETMTVDYNKMIVRIEPQ
jgi:hypothetical protein